MVARAATVVGRYNDCPFVTNGPGQLRWCELAHESVRECFSGVLHVLEAQSFASSECDGVVGVEDLHVWQVCSQRTVRAVRITETVTTLEEQERFARERTRHTDRGSDRATVGSSGSIESDSSPTGSNHSH